MKKFFAAVTVIVALVIAMPTVTFAYDSIQTVNCSWWGKMVNRKPTEAERQRQIQQRQWQEQQRRRREAERKREIERRREAERQIVERQRQQQRY